MSKPISIVAISSFSRIVLVRTSVLGLNNSLQTIIPLSSIFPSFSQEEYEKDYQELPDWWLQDLARKGALFFTEKMHKKRVIERIKSFSLRDEVIHFGELGIYWGKYTEAEYLKTSYHKQLIKEDFYRQITI
jgi:hypothetical protein